MAQPLIHRAKGAHDDESVELLSPFNQAAPRVYVTIVLCFPLSDVSIKDCRDHLEDSLASLAKERPMFASTLRTGSQMPPGFAYLHPSDVIPFTFSEAYPNNTESSDTVYENMKGRGFSPRIFLDPGFGRPGPIEAGADPLPVAKIHANFVQGGLFLQVYVHHSILDGDSIRIFLDCLAAQTRGGQQHVEHPYPTKQALRIPPKAGSSSSVFSVLIRKTPEYTRLPDKSGPTQPKFLDCATKSMQEIKSKGKIFIFSHQRIEQLRQLLILHSGMAGSMTSYNVLASLVFAHITKARKTSENYFGDSEPGKTDTASLWNSVNWKARAFKELTDEYFGNATLPVVTKVRTDTLIEGCADLKALAKVAVAVKASIDNVDDNYVQKRLSTISAAPDPRLIGVNYDPRMFNSLAFNTWRHFGADTVWCLKPGAKECKPDALRRGVNRWGLGTALVLPASIGSTKQEVFINLSEEAMKELCQDDSFLRWVNEVIA